MADSKEQQILAAIYTAINATGKPTGLTVSRERLLEMAPSQLPHVSIYPMEASTTRTGYMGQTTLTVKVSIWVGGTAGGIVSQTIDPIWQWIHSQIQGDESLNGLAIKCEQTSRTYGFSIAQQPFGDLDITFQVLYRHNLTDPTK